MLKNISLKLLDLTKNSYYVFFDICLIIFGCIILFVKREMFFDKSIVYVTASDENYFKRSMNLLRSINKFDSKQKVVFYDLGLNETQQKTLLEFANVTVKKFNFEEYPKFISERRDNHEKLGEYGWKGIIFKTELTNSESSVLWLDAACVLTKNPLLIKLLISAYGFFATYSSNNISDWTHKDTLNYFNFPKNLYSKRNFMSGIVGSDKSNSSLNLVSQWSKYSQIEECIAPKNSNRFNHRQDQAVLTLLIYINKIQNTCSKYYKIYGIKIGQTFSKFYIQVNKLDTKNENYANAIIKNNPSIITNSIEKAKSIVLLDYKKISRKIKKLLKDKKIYVVIYDIAEIDNVLKDDVFKINKIIFILVDEISSQTNPSHVKLFKFENINQVDLKKLDLEIE